MSFKTYLKRGISYILHGVRPIDVRADIHYLSPGNSLKDKRIIVTGGGRGLGLAMARKFINEGAQVLIAGRNEDTLRKSASELGCEWLQLDMQQLDTFDTFVKDSVQKLGCVNCLVNNAGISLHEPTFFDVTEESFEAQLKTNLKGPFFLTQALAAYMKSNGIKGNILFMSSETGDVADIRPYGLIKASINSLVRGLAHLFVKDGIRVNALAPGVTASDMTGLRADGNLSYSYNANGRVFLPEEVAECASFLLSDVSGCVTGQIITCNSGTTINSRV